MKKGIAILMILALVVSAIPAFAGETDEPVDTVTSATSAGGQSTPGSGQHSRNGQQAPAMPGRGRDGRNGQQFPGMPGGAQNAPDSRQAPVMPDNSQAAPDSESTPDAQQAPDASIKGQKGRGTRNQGKTGKAGLTKKTSAWLDQLLADGVITQEIHDAIVTWLEAQQVQAAAAEPAEGAEPPALPDGTAPAEGTEPPALPDGTAPAEGTEPPAVPEAETPASPEAMLLKQLLDSGVITQEQYDELLPAFLSPAPAESNG